MSGNEPARWHALGRVDTLPLDAPCGGSAGGGEVVAVFADGAWRAYDGRCPHQGTLLAEGELQAADGEAPALVCRAHGWRFDCASGARRGGAGALEPLECRVRDGVLEVRAGASAAAAGRRSIADLPGPRGWPLVGNTFDVDPKTSHLQLEAWARELGPMYRVRIGLSDIVVLADARLNEAALKARPGAFRRVSNIERVIAELGAAGVFSVEGDDWRRQRRLAMEALSNRHIKGFYPTLVRVAERLLRRWEGEADRGAPIDIGDDLQRFTVDVTTSLAFGVDMNTLEKDEVIQRHLAHVFPALGRRVLAPIPYWRFVRLPADRALERALVEIRGVLDPLIARTRERLDATPEPERHARNFLEAMILARDDDGRPFADEVIFGNTLTMLLAGEDTTSHSLSWYVHELCERPDLQAAIRAEVDAALGAHAVPPDVETAHALPYVDAVTQEVMRLRSVAAFILLEANEDTVLDDVAVPAGTKVFVLLRAPGLSERSFSEPRALRPERWLQPPAPGVAHDPRALIPFGSGPRICPGRSLALLEIRVVVATLLKNFEFERVGEPAAVHEEMLFTVVPRGLSVRLRRRAGASASAAAAR